MRAVRHEPQPRPQEIAQREGAQEMGGCEMTDLQKRAAEIAELRAKASKGPWTAVFDGWWGWEVRPYRPDIRPPYTASPVCRVELNEKVNKRNAAFIAAAHDMADLIAEQAAEIERLRGIEANIPGRPAHGNGPEHQREGIPRYGIRWNGPQSPLAVPMDDGYWTPWHMAVATIDAAMKKENAP